MTYRPEPLNEHEQARVKALQRQLGAVKTITTGPAQWSILTPMVVVRPLSRDEAASVFPRRGQIDISEYIDALRTIAPGEAAEIELDGLTRRSVKRRMGMAARQLNLALKWARTFDDEDVLIFQVRVAIPNRIPRPRRVPARV